MCTTLIDQMFCVQHRLKHRWQATEIPHEIPTAHHAIALIEMYRDLINRDLFVESAHPSSNGSLSYKGLSVMMNVLQVLKHGHWHHLESDNVSSQLCYMHDLLLYLGVSYYTAQRIHCLVPDGDHTKLPSLCRIMPQFPPSFDIEPMVLWLGERPGWLSDILSQDFRCPLFAQLGHLKQVSEMSPLVHPLISLVVSYANLCKKYPPHYHEDEKHLQLINDHLLSALDFEESLTQPHDLGHQLLKLFLQSGVKEDEFPHLVMTTYVDFILRECKEELLINEKNYWAQQKALWADSPSKIAFVEYHIDHALSKQLATTDHLSPSDKIIWKTGGMAFASMIVDLIANDTIEFKGNRDLAPITERLYSFFAIQLKNGGGFITKDSLHTYIKKVHSEI